MYNTTHSAKKKSKKAEQEEALKTLRADKLKLLFNITQCRDGYTKLLNQYSSLQALVKNLEDDGDRLQEEVRTVLFGRRTLICLLQNDKMVDKIDILQEIADDHAVLKQKVSALETELSNPRQHVRDNVQAERARCDTADKKRIAELEKKVAALRESTKRARAESAAAQRSAAKAKNHWQVFREADFRSLEDRVGLHCTK
jgi:hypothetical protein